ncbi:MAG TPA: molybdopterin-synthase adenylyltransferase MoeB [Candidatus Acidoferrales bacterium]|nr:molybdopterin-synthase adenylyltransferase MoeB [Candidatus Acidoferrales bacterium]
MPTPSLPDLTPAERRRYGRHLILSEVGLEGQQRLKAGRVLLVGAGGLGSPAALYLAAAGVGTIGVVDFDAVDESNLQRQIAHGTAAIGRAKLDSLRERLRDLNPHVTLEPHAVRLDRTNALEVLGGYDVVLDGSDNFPTRYLVNDACVLLGKPNCYGSILRFEGQASVFDATRGPCYRCLYPQPPDPGVVPSCAEAGVLGVLPGVIGAIQATEAIKLLLGAPETLIGRLVLYDAWTLTFRELRLRKDPACPLCGAHPTIRELIDYEDFCGLKADPVAAEPPGETMSVREYAERRARGEDFVLLDVREAGELAIARLGGEVHIPLAMVPLRANELDRSRAIVVVCHVGARGARAAHWLREHGFTRVHNLAGGIEAYAREVDPSIPRY